MEELLVEDQKRIPQDFKIKNYAANLIIFFLSVYVVINPLPHTTTIQGICLYGAVLLFVAMNSVGKINIFQFQTPLLVPTILFVVWVLAGLFFAVDKQNSAHDLYSHLFKYLILCILFVNIFNTRKKIEVLSWVIIFSVVSFVMYSFFTFYVVGGNDISVKFFGNSQGMTYNLLSIPVIFAVFLILCNSVTVTKVYSKILILLLLVPLVSASVLTQARSAFLALAISSFVFMFFYKKILIPVVLIICAGILMFAPLKNRFSQDVSSNLRLNHALLVLEVLKDYPVSGIGFGMETFGYSLDLNSYKNKFERTYNTQYGHEVVLIDPHNMYTDILVRTGIPGFALYMFFVFSLCRMLWEVRLSQDVFPRVWSLGVASALVAYFIIGFFEPVFSHVHEFYFALMVSLVVALWKQHKDETLNLQRG
ncbi:MAG: O-antigen ligase family protein [Desulfurivibrionaceae bacterium]